MLNTIINHRRTGYPYRMCVLYNKVQNRWILSFACMKHGNNHGEEHSLPSFQEALRHFNANCRFYDIPEQYCSEEEFLGLKEGTIFPLPAPAARTTPAAVKQTHAASRTRKTFNYLTEVVRNDKEDYDVRR